MNKTIEYYNKNSQKLCERYNSVDLSVLHNDLLEFFRKSETLLEIGSGSGRDMSFMIQNGFEVFGIDGSEKMIRNAVYSYPELKNRLFLSELPENSHLFDIKFDGMYSIATLMHLNKDELNLFLKKVKLFLNPDSLVFISVSGQRGSQKDNRFFMELSKDEWIRIFQFNNFEILKVKENKDLSGREIDWYSFFLKTVS